MNFHQSFKKVQQFHSRHQKTTSNLLRIHLKAKFRFGNGSLLEEAMSINLLQKILGTSQNVLFFFSQNVDGFKQNDSQGF